MEKKISKNAQNHLKNLSCQKIADLGVFSSQVKIAALGSEKANFQIKRNSSCDAGTNWQYLYTNDNAITNDIWQHLVCTYDGTTMKFYKNGMLIQSYVPTAGPIDNCSGDYAENLRTISENFFRELHNISSTDLADVNNFNRVNGYNQPVIKDRVIACLKDMVEAGY